MEIIKNSIWSIDQFDGVTTGNYRVIQVFEEIPCIILFYLEKEKGLSRPIAIGLDKFK